MAFAPTSAQQNIYDFVGCGAGNGIIDAVAGAGKTTTLIGCIDYIADTREVLYCAFNTSIRKEIQKKFQKKGKSVAVKTIHGLGFQILRTYYHKLELDDDKYSKILEHRDFFESVAFEVDSILNSYHFLSTEEIKSMQSRSKDLSIEEKNLLNESLKKLSEVTCQILNINQKYRLTLCGSEFSDYKSMVDHFCIIEGYTDDALKQYISIHQKLLKEGNSMAVSANVIDYTDMLYLPMHLKLESKYKYGFVFVDECQDLSRAQLAVVRKYLRPDSRVLAVGDPYQSIYGFAGADVSSFENVKQTFDCQPLSLTDCFRCPQSVIRLAQSIREDINGFKTDEGVVECIESRFVLANLRPGDLVICRHRAPLLSLAMKLVNNDVRVHLHPDEVQEFIGDYKRYFKASELRKKLDDETIGNFLDIVRKRNVRQIKYDCKNVDAVIRDMKIQNEIKFMEDCLDFFLRKYKEWQINAIGSILIRLKELMSYLGEDAVRISTIHRAKGLENERVFILEYNKLPLERQLQWERIQERNLKYVAVTRPAKELYLCYEPTELDEVDEMPSGDDMDYAVDFDMDPPFMIEEDGDEPERENIEHKYNSIKFSPIVTLSTIPKKYYSFGEVAETPYLGLNGRLCQRAKYWAIYEALQDTEYSISNVLSSNYLDAYVLISPNGSRTYNGHYSAAGTYKFLPKEPYEDNETVLKYLSDESNYSITFEYKPQNDGFDAVHAIIKAGCLEHGILITNVYREAYSLTYCLKTPKAYAYIKLAFNGKGIITTLTPYSSIGEDDKELTKLLEIISHLWQR